MHTLNPRPQVFLLGGEHRVASRVCGSLLIRVRAGLVLVLGIPFPVYLYYHGAEIRARSKLTQVSLCPF